MERIRKQKIQEKLKKEIKSQPKKAQEKIEITQKVDPNQDHEMKIEDHRNTRDDSFPDSIPISDPKLA